jgi:Protein of unknown function (DUF3501)
MARVEKMATDAEIEDELAVYNPLIPGPGEISMTMFIELTSEASLREWLPRLAGIERSLKAVIGEGPRALVVRASLDAAHASQLTREETTASVHYVRLRVPAGALDGFVSRRVVLGCAILRTGTKPSSLAWRRSRSRATGRAGREGLYKFGAI